MNNIKNFYKNIISYNLITKNNYSNIFEILNINKKLLIFIFPTMDQNFIKLNNKINNILNFKINNILNFFELESEFLKFKDIPNIDISIQTNSTNNNNLQLLFNQYYFPIK